MSTSLSRWERILYVMILVLAVFSRFYILGERAMSHDESLHTKYSWNLYAGDGFQHNPMMHGPLLFEATALTYTLFGVNDFTSRIFTAVAGIGLVMMPLLFRRWLGRTGALATSVLLLISPSISYYSRYIRHDVLLMVTAVLLLWVILQYLETQKGKWLLWLAAFFSLMYATKEASYIYTAIFGALLFLPFAGQVMRAPWHNPRLLRPLLVLLLAATILAGVFGLALTTSPVDETPLDETGDAAVASTALPLWGQIAATLALAAFGVALIVVFYGVGERTMRRFPLFDVLMVLGTLTLPLGSAFLIRFAAGVDMDVVYNAVRTGDFATVPTATAVAIFGVTAAALAISVAFGLWWDKDRWPKIALTHYAIFIVLYTTIFTWGFGALSGLIGGLAYWMAQHGVTRGNQPGYYYLLIGPLYEYLAITLSVGGGLAAITGGFLAWRRRPKRAETGEPSEGASVSLPALDLKVLLPLFLAGWTFLSWIAYTYAGEKMPWLLVHIALPSIFLGGWGLGRLLDAVSWADLRSRPGWLLLLAVPLTVAALVVFGSGVGALRSAWAGGVSTAGPSLDQLWSLGRTLGGLIGVVAFGAALVWAVTRLGGERSLRWVGLLAVVALGVLTVRTMAMLNYVNYDLATEFLVYAHGTPDIKTALGQIREVSWQVTGSSRDVRVAYSEDGSWPFNWYMVDFPNAYFYGTTPDATQLLECPAVIAGRKQYDVVDLILANEYVAYDYNYLWWPIQDYFKLTWKRVAGALTDPEMRAALWDIVWRRDYDAFAMLKYSNAPFTLHSWPYRNEFRLYVRREVAETLWPYSRPGGSARHVEPKATVLPDPYAAGARMLPEVSATLLPGAVVRGLAPVGDGTFLVADAANHRILHVGSDGVLASFGGYGSGEAQFNEPWDVAVDAEGNIYVADTWNHRIQKFDSERRFLKSWGEGAQVSQIGLPGAQVGFFGPRALAISPAGELYVADTGNKRIQVFDLDGTFLREFGGGGSRAGQLDEPVGIAVNDRGLVAVADTWNRRIQLFDPNGLALRQWDVPSWDVASADVKPFLAWGKDSLFVTDPLRRRVLAFDEQGSFLWALSADAGASLSFPQDVWVTDDVLYVTDAHRGALVGYDLAE